MYVIWLTSLLVEGAHSLLFGGSLLLLATHAAQIEPVEATLDFALQCTLTFVLLLLLLKPRVERHLGLLWLRGARISSLFKGNIFSIVVVLVLELD